MDGMKIALPFDTRQLEAIWNFVVVMFHFLLYALLNEF